TPRFAQQRRRLGAAELSVSPLSSSSSMTFLRELDVELPSPLSGGGEWVTTRRSLVGRLWPNLFTATILISYIVLSLSGPSSVSVRLAASTTATVSGFSSTDPFACWRQLSSNVVNSL